MAWMHSSTDSTDYIWRNQATLTFKQRPWKELQKGRLMRWSYTTTWSVKEGSRCPPDRNSKRRGSCTVEIRQDKTRQWGKCVKFSTWYGYSEKCGRRIVADNCKPNVYSTKKKLEKKPNKSKVAKRKHLQLLMSFDDDDDENQHSANINEEGNRLSTSLVSSLAAEASSSSSSSFKSSEIMSMFRRTD